MMQTKLLLAASTLHLVAPLPAHTASAVVATASWMLLRAAYSWARATPQPVHTIMDAAMRQVHGFRRAASSIGVGGV